MQRIAIIPARYASTRLPGKPLLDICGKPMLLRVYEQTLKSSMDKVFIATDDKRIYDKMNELGCEVCMTSTEHRSGTDRLAEVLEIIKADDNDIIVNVQGDEPLMPPEVIDQVANLLKDNPKVPMSTLSTTITEQQMLSNPNVVKVISNNRGEAIYFSRAEIPFRRDRHGATTTGHSIFQRHIGLYAYRAHFLHQFSKWPACELEMTESLEQLRVLWHGEKIQVAEAISVPPEGVDTEQDLAMTRDIVRSRKNINKQS